MNDEVNLDKIDLQNITFDDANELVIDSFKHVNYLNNLELSLSKVDRFFFKDEERHIMNLKIAAGFLEAYLMSQDFSQSSHYLLLAKSNLNILAEKAPKADLEKNYVFKTIRGFTYALSKDFDKAKEVLSYAKNLNDNPVVNLYLGCLYINIGESEKAEKLLEESVKLLKPGAGISECKAAFESALLSRSKLLKNQVSDVDVVESMMKESLQKIYQKELESYAVFLNVKLSAANAVNVLSKRL